MIKIDFSEPTDAEWKEWRVRCNDATAELITTVATGGKPVISSVLYKEQKVVYMAFDGPFHGKCAYCESLIAADQPGDVEHYRPKGRVTVNNSSANSVTFVEAGVTKPHPGYYWLAYDWQNLLPSCIDCNRPNENKLPGVHMGKRNYFPVKAYRAVHPGDEIKEEPLLINPVSQEPSAHLKIDDTGLFEALTAEGQECIDVFCLNLREPLVDARKTAYEGAKDKILSLAAALLLGSSKAKSLLDQLETIKSGEKPYSAAARAAITNERHTLDPLVNLLS